MHFLAVLPSPAGAIDPDAVRVVFDTYAGIIMFVVGLLYTRLPALKNLPNKAIPWVNLIGYVLAKFAVPDAHAGALGALAGFGGLLWTVAKGGATSALTSLLYDKFLKHPLDHALPAAVPTGGWPTRPFSAVLLLAGGLLLLPAGAHAAPRLGTLALKQTTTTVTESGASEYGLKYAIGAGVRRDVPRNEYGTQAWLGARLIYALEFLDLKPELEVKRDLGRNPVTGVALGVWRTF